MTASINVTVNGDMREFDSGSRLEDLLRVRPGERIAVDGMLRILRPRLFDEVSLD